MPSSQPETIKNVKYVPAILRLARLLKVPSRRPACAPGQCRAVHANSALDHTRCCSGRGARVQVVRSIPQLHVIIHGLVKGFQSIMCGATRNVQYNVQPRVELP